MSDDLDLAYLMRDLDDFIKNNDAVFLLDKFKDNYPDTYKRLITAAAYEMGSTYEERKAALLNSRKGG